MSSDVVTPAVLIMACWFRLFFLWEENEAKTNKQKQNGGWDNEKKKVTKKAQQT